eukprot:1400291-Prymnesium_polylepis.1
MENSAVSMPCGSPYHNIDASADNPIGLCRDLAGVRTFTGIVKKGQLLPDDLFKLDDPRGPLDGPGHVMHQNEFLAEMSMYDGSESLRCQKHAPAENMEHKPVEETRLVSRMTEAPIDVIFPFERRSDGSLRAHVRSDDVVAISVVCNRNALAEEEPTFYRERFWALVVAITSGGVVVAAPRSQLKWMPIGPHAPIYFDASAVIAVKHGCNW